MRTWQLGEHGVQEGAKLGLDYLAIWRNAALGLTGRRLWVGGQRSGWWIQVVWVVSGIPEDILVQLSDKLLIFFVILRYISVHHQRIIFCVRVRFKIRIRIYLDEIVTCGCDGGSYGKFVRRRRR